MCPEGQICKGRFPFIIINIGHPRGAHPTGNIDFVRGNSCGCPQNIIQKKVEHIGGTENDKSWFLENMEIGGKNEII